MAEHMSHWTMGSWIMLAAFLGVLGLGVVIAVIAARGRSSGRAHALLGERLARSEISVEEYRERLTVLGPRARRFLTPMATVLTAVGLVGAIVLGATAGSGFMHGTMSGMGSMMGGGNTERSGAAPVTGGREVRVVAREFSFDPQEIRLGQGETLNLVFENQGHIFHTLTIGELGLDLRANGGDRIGGALTAEQPGRYTFICSVSGHADAGMRGTVIVSEAS
ncbi:MAG: cupredoxin domain-containing protein [Actinomycetota bacterium]